MAGEPIPAQDNGENGLEVLAKAVTKSAKNPTMASDSLADMLEQHQL